jgi:hypothetical protein
MIPALRRSVVPTCAALGVLVVGCSPGPSQVGAAAIVGNQRIPVDAVQSQLGRLAAARPAASRQALQQGTLPQTSRELLTEEIRGALLDAVRSRRDLAVPRGQVAQSVAAVRKKGGRSLAAAERAQVRSAVTDQLYQLALARKTLGKLSMAVDVVPAGGRADAEATARRLARNPAALARVTRGDSALHAHYTGVALARNNLGLLPLLGARDESTLAFPLRAPTGQPQWVVGYVHERTLGKANPATEKALGTIDQKVLIASGRYLLAPTARRLGVRVNPRYGEFDPVAVSVVPSRGDAAGLDVPVPSPVS